MIICGGENGIRTHERVASLHTFQACALNHSATPPIKFYFFFSQLDYFENIQ